MSEEFLCKGNHECHICDLIKKKRLSEIKPLVDRPRFICFNCGRAANDAESVCNPQPLG